MNDQTEVRTRLLVMPERDGDRLDIFLAATTDLSRRAARRIIADGQVWRNGGPLRVQSKSVAIGDVVDLGLPDSELGIDTASPPATIDVLFDDRSLLIAAKRAGVLSQPKEGRAPGDPLSFDQQVLLALAWREGSKPYLRMVHRLDRMTSGAVLFARSPDVLPGLTRCWGDGRVERFYLAVVEGHPSSKAFDVDLPIARDFDHRWRFQCDDSGKASRTEIEVIAELDEDLSVVGCRLDTGRTHQVRVHLAAAGHPVLGDRLYNSRRAEQAQRPLLHAASLGLPHPSTGDRLHVVSPPPADIAKYLPEDLDLSDI